MTGRFRIGVNFWSRHAGPRMWSRVDDARLHAELAQARAIGIDILRPFAFIPDFVYPDGTVDDRPASRMRRFAREAARLDIALLPSFLVGHMSGENFELPGAGDPIDDPVAADHCAALIGKLTQALDDVPSVVGWALSNELPLWLRTHEGRALDQDKLLPWLARMIAACRAHSDKPIGLGDGQLGPFGSAAIAAEVDFVGPHPYHADPDPLRQGLRFDHALALSARFGKPVLLEEFGGSSTQAGDPELAALWNEAIFASFTRGALGAIGWCWSDFDIDTIGREIPYSHHGFELRFGVTRADGSEKPTCDVLRGWRALLDDLPDAPQIPAASQAALVRSSWLDREYPFSWFDRGAADRVERTAFAIAQQANLTPTIHDEAKLPELPLLLVPCTQRLLTETWLALEAAAQRGATVYWSYHGGDHEFHQGLWCPIFERLTGCAHRLRYGCFEVPPKTLRLDGALATLPPLPTRATSGASAAFIPIEPGPNVRVLSRDQDGRPMLVEHSLGRGRVIFAAAPLERYAADRADATQRGLVVLYRLLGERAGIADPLGLRALDPAIAERLTVAEVSVGERKLIAAMNRSWQPLALPASLAGPRRASVAPLGEVDGGLAAKQAILLDAR